MTLTVIIASALAVLETSVSKELNDNKIDKLEFSMPQTLYYKSFNNLSNIDHKMEAEIRSQLQKSQWEEISDLRKELRKRYTS